MTKEFKTHKFHSRELIPYEKGQEGIEDLEKVLLWIDAYSEDHRFKEGDEVCHKENLEQKMIVNKILKKTIEIPINGTKEKKTKMIGIECHWFQKTI